VAAGEVAGVVMEQRPSALYRVVLDSGHEVLAHVAGTRRGNFVRVLVGDRVLVALSPRDQTRGRLVERL
jgi:translation initiation factor IF-1